jgi:DNA polymerase-3 subunit alpha
MNALYRPGPMANIPKFISRKNGKTSINYIHPSLKPILKETYGIIVYQEQVMQISQIIGGFSLAQGDMLRRAMGKKKAKLMAAFKVDFVKGATENKIDKKLAVEIFDLLEKFAQYGFNKSHSTAYALVAYQTAWLKTHYPAEFFAANLSSEMFNTDRVVSLLSSAKRNNLTILSPNINTSYSDFRALDAKHIAYGLAAVKNIGSKAADILSNHREKSGKYLNIFEICSIDSHIINRKVLESLICSGACDDIHNNRAQLFENMEIMIKWGQKKSMEYASGQESLFMSGNSDYETSYPNLSETNDWTREDCLKKEKNILGFYLSGNPLEKYQSDLNEFTNINLDKIPEKKPKKIKIGGIIQKINKRYDKKNRQWAIIELHGIIGKADVFVFSNIFEKYNDLLLEDECVFIVGSPSNRDDDDDSLKMIAEIIHPLSNVRKILSQSVNILINSNQIEEKLLDELMLSSYDNMGKCKLFLHLKSENGGVQKIRLNKLKVNTEIEFITKIREIFGKKNVWID